MKKMYVSPEMNVEAFAANDYVAACYDVYCTGSSSSYFWGLYVPTHRTHNSAVHDQDNRENVVLGTKIKADNEASAMAQEGFDSRCEKVAYLNSERPNASI